MVEIVLCSKLSYALTWCLLLTAEQLSHYYPLEWYIDQTIRYRGARDWGERGIEAGPQGPIQREGVVWWRPFAACQFLLLWEALLTPECLAMPKKATLHSFGWALIGPGLNFAPDSHTATPLLWGFFYFISLHFLNNYWNKKWWDVLKRLYLNFSN
jgi:hypothetical protein